jgi:hypothetical protein
MSKRFRLTPPKTNIVEKHVVEACVDYLRLRGYWCIRQHVGLFKTPDNRWIRMGTPGIPDYATIHARYPGFLVEFKRPGKDLADGQRTKFEEIRQGYSLAVVKVDSLEELVLWLNRHEIRARDRGP